VLNRGQLEEFAQRGFLMLPGVVPRAVVDAAARAIDELIDREPPGPDVRGPFNYFPEAARAPELAALLTGSPAFGLAEALTGPATHHIDGFPPEPGGRPGTFTMLAGVLMSDQRAQDAGNLWVWPGTHLTHAEYFRGHGPGAFFAAGGYPPIKLPEPEQVTGEAGDLLLAHYLLGHNIGGNTSQAVRRAVYYRVKRAGHDPRWRAFLADPWLDYDAIRGVLA